MPKQPLGFPVFSWYRRGRLWVAPTTGALVALMAGAAALLLDRHVFSPDTAFPKFVDQVETARSLLTVTATSIATLTALVLTIVAIVLELASNSYSHRAVRTLLQDPHSHWTLAMFVGTFTYALMVLLGIGATVEGDTGVVAGLSVPGAFVLAVLALGTFVIYIDHIVHTARGTSIIDRIGNDTRAEIDRLFPATLEEADPYPEGTVPDGSPEVVHSQGHGNIFEMDVEGMIEWAAAHDAKVIMVPAVGDFVPADSPLLHVYGNGDAADLQHAIRLDAERTITDDVGFGFRLVVDIAARALSPGSNDPATAVQCIDQLHETLNRLVKRRFPTGWYAGTDGRARLYIPPTTWEDLVSLACDEIRLYGMGHLQVARRLRAMLLDLAEKADDERRVALDRQIRLLGALNEESFTEPEDRETAQDPDPQGLGGRSGPDRKRVRT